MTLSGCSGSAGEDGSDILDDILGGNQSPDPVTLDFPLVYVKRALVVEDQDPLAQGDVRDPTQFRPGAELFVRDRASPSAIEVSITAGVFESDDEDEDNDAPLYDVKDLSASYDGTQAVFAMRAPRDPDLDDDEQPTWNIWLYDHPTTTVSRLIESDIVAEEGHDVAPRFLVDGRVLFSSTRQRQARAILLDEGKPQFAHLDEDRDDEATSLHVMEADGSEIRQISFNQSSDLDPALLDDGRIVYSRWDNVDDINHISLYTMLPDGRGQELLYGTNSHDTLEDAPPIEFVQAQQLPDGRVFTLLRPRGASDEFGTLPVAIDVTNFTDNDQATPDGAGTSTTAQELLIDGDLTIGAGISPAGRYASIAPLYDGTDRLLVTWNQCRLTDGENILPCTEENLALGLAEAEPFFGIWIHDLFEDTQQPIVIPEEGEALTEAVVLEVRPLPEAIPDGVAGIDLDTDLVAESVGVLNIRSVYDLDGLGQTAIEQFRDPAQSVAADRPARFLRLVKAVSMADDDIVDIDNTAFGRSRAQLMREILGYAPIEPDGSVITKVPANVAFYMTVVDADGKRIGPRHQNWLQLRPGEERTCVGCHDPDIEVSHGRADASPPSANPGAPFDGSPFPNSEPALFANAGESMAEVAARINGVPTPSVDLRYTDIWTDPAVRAKDDDLVITYSALQSTPPTATSCVTTWTAACRIVVNYEANIHPIWSVDRSTLDIDGVTVLADNTCTSCHAPVDAAGLVQVPAQQLDLSDGPSPDEADHFNSYRELLFNDNEQEIIDGALLDRLIDATDGNGNTIFQTDADGNLLLDENGQPIPVQVTVQVNSVMNVGGALASPAFFAPFEAGGSHEDYLTPAELKLISEWLDIGAQYYNNPFDVPP